MSFSYVPL